MQHLILASASPRRKELLQQIHLQFTIQSSDVDESFDPSLSPQEVVQFLAQKKASDIAEKNSNAYIIGSDTVVVLNNEILGKPKDRQDAKFMLLSLSGNTHEVFTGVAIISPTEQITFFEKTEVTFLELSEEEIERYLDSGEPFDKAGAYGIQGLGATFVQKINGDYFSVVGMPLSRTFRELQNLGFQTY